LRDASGCVWWCEAGKRKHMSKLFKAFSSDITPVAGERAVMARISTSSVDRDGDVLVPQGCNYKNYEKNPVVFWNHDASSLPVGKATGFQKGDETIDAKVIFAARPDTLPEGEEWMPDTLFSLYQQGILNAFSVGLIPTETRPANDRDLQKYGECKRVVSKWELYEFSCVPLPANQDAIALAVSKGCKPDVAEEWIAKHAAKVVAAKVAPVAAITPPQSPQPKTIKQNVVIIRRHVDESERLNRAVRQAVAKAMGRIYQD